VPGELDGLVAAVTGGGSGIGLATVRLLAARGVEFAEEPSRQFWGWWAVFKDPDGNSYGLGQRGE
jgi:hypothetical protein